MDVRQLFTATLTQHQAGRLSEAEAGYRKILAVAPNHTDSLHLLGVVATQTGRHREAIGLIGRAIAGSKNPAAELHNNLGLAHRGLGEHTQAIRQFEKAVMLKPAYVDAHINLGAILLDEGRLDEAEEHCRRALALKPGSAQAHFALGAVRHRKGNLAASAASYREALRLRPAYPEAWCNLGAVLQDQGAFDEAAKALDQALRLRPDYAMAHYNLGAVRQDQARGDDALACYRRAQALKPDYAEAHWNEALLRLSRGEFIAGWAKYAWRSGLKAYAPHASEKPKWAGDDLSGRSILLHAEQGIGDTIQFVRYAQLVKARGAARVILECPPGLGRLLETVGGIDRIVRKGEDPAPDFDCHVPLPSLPGLFGTTLDTIPAVVPYLVADPAKIENWRRKLPSDQKLRVGLVWRGNPLNTRDATRSIPVEQFAPLCAVPGVDWVNLQIDARPDELDALTTQGVIHDFASDIADWADTAALIAALDLVVTVDTAVAHLTGALGKPVWVLLSFVAHWCWLTERRDCPWYPTASLFRQSERRDWDPVIAKVRGEVSRL